MQYDLSDLSSNIIVSAIDKVLTSDLFRVIAVNNEKQTVDLEPCIKVWEAANDGELKIDKFGDYKLMQPTTNNIYLVNVPVQQIRCGQFSITIPVSVGDCGIVHFLKNDTQNWRVTGGQANALLVSPYDRTSCVYSGYVPSEASIDPAFNINSLEIKSKSVIIRVNEENIDIITASGVNITGDTKITGNLEVSGTVTGSDCLTASGVSLQNHTHSYQDTQPNGQPATKETLVPTV